MTFKQIFCKHIWKETERIFLKKEERWSNAGAFIDCDVYNTYAVKRHCLKCKKEEIVEDWKWVTGY